MADSTNGSGFPKIGEYNSSTFYLHSTDTDGNSATVRVGASVYRITPGMARAIQEMINDAELPYRTQGDVVRDLLVHGWHVRKDNKTQDDLFSAHIVHLDLIRRKLEIEAIHSAFIELQKYAISLREAGANNKQIKAATSQSIYALRTSARASDIELDFTLAYQAYMRFVFHK